jgi:hypothetical protein
MAQGGRRVGAGRPIGAIAKVKKTIATKVLKKAEEQKIWAELLASDDHRIVLDAMKYLTDRRDGKASQPIEHSGTINYTEALTRMRAKRDE